MSVGHMGGGDTSEVSFGHNGRMVGMVVGVGGWSVPLAFLSLTDARVAKKELERAIERAEAEAVGTAVDEERHPPAPQPASDSAAGRPP
ncbi:MAG: hypothetical protein ACREJO_03480 [Phycisphaerales bacterium]